MSSLGNKDIMAGNIQRFLDISGKTRTQICKDLDIPYTTFVDWIKGNTYPRIDKIEQMANYFGVEKADLVEPKEARIVPSSVNIPLYDHISCGTGMFVDDRPEDYIAIPDKYLTPGVEYFANTAHGDSMINKGIKDGDVLVFERTSVLESGMIGSFCIDNEKAYCKIYRRLPNGMIMLESANDRYDPIMIDVTNECFRIIGRYKFKFSIEQ